MVGHDRPDGDTGDDKWITSLQSVDADRTFIGWDHQICSVTEFFGEFDQTIQVIEAGGSYQLLMAEHSLAQQGQAQ